MNIANESCTNEECGRKEAQLRLAKLREELLTNFNTLLIERIRFLEETISRLAAPTPTISPPQTWTDPYLSPEMIKVNRLMPPPSLRRSSSESTHLQLCSNSPTLTNVRGVFLPCLSSVDLSKNNDQQKILRVQGRTSSDSGNNSYLCIPTQRQWASSTSDLLSSTTTSSDKGRLEARRFACDVDDNDVRAFKALLYTEQARKQNSRPLTRLRQALGI